MTAETSSKLAFFLELALHGQQFPLILFDKSGKEKQERELNELLLKKATPTLQALEQREAVFEEVLKETLSPAPDLFNPGAPGSFILFTVRLDRSGLEKALEAVRQVRLSGTFEMQGRRLQFPDYMKFLFLLDEDILAGLKADLQDKLLYSFSPVYRFNA